MRTFELSGVSIQALAVEEAVREVRSWLEEEGVTKTIYTPNPEILWNAQRDAAVRRALQRGALLVPDGIGVVLAARLKGVKEIRRLTGIDLAETILRTLRPPTYLLGAREGVAERAAHRLREWGVRVTGVHHGFFDEKDVPAILDGVNRSGARLLLVALGSPRQEIFLDAHQADLKVPVAMAVGGTFDVWAGDKRRAPIMVRRLGLEWMWRTLREPRRLGRLWPLVVFLWQVVLGGGGRGRSGSR